MHRKGIGEERRIFFDIQRKVTAHKTLEAWNNIPHAGPVVDLDVTDLLDLVEKLKHSQEFADVRLTFNSVLLKLISEGLKASPELNAHVEYHARLDIGVITMFEDINMAMPVLLDDGRTITPVMKHVNRKSLKEVCAAMEDIKQRLNKTDVDILLFEAGYRDSLKKLKRGNISVLGRAFANLMGKAKVHVPSRREIKEYRRIHEEDRITVDDLLSATILVSNVGSIMPELRSHFGLLEIIPPQAAVIGVGAVRKTPTVVTDEDGKDTIEIRRVVPLTLYFDHRAMDFSHTLGFFKRVSEICRTPTLLVSPCG